MSPTSYQTAPPRDLIITTSLTASNLSRRHVTANLQALSSSACALACVHDFRGIDGFVVDLFFKDFSIFADQKIHPAGGFVFVDVDAVLRG